jgi:myo-inositol-1-phosphate synthase
MKENHPTIAPSMLYAWAAITSGVPFANGAPNLTVDVPALIELARDHQVPICGKDFKTGQTLMKTILAPGFKARLLGMNGWFSTNILGNRDGEVLDDPESFKRGARVHPATQAVSGPLRHDSSQGAHQLLPAARRQQRRLGQHRHLRLAGLSNGN